ncbi:PUA-like domain-containing protein [Diplogelasinospora grovesii]|uniref:Thymocyte nuclear protein 1 n=1 Tax=Diplogelasinospora grovesii TaxID=303347 RepID=A0AAN6N7V7_9PEZI|nr:PUA-like domain-containing protein [Diplogelasinospora grovesii]
MPKRKSTHAEESAAEPLLRRSSRNTKAASAIPANEDASPARSKAKKATAKPDADEGKTDKKTRAPKKTKPEKVVEPAEKEDAELPPSKKSRTRKQASKVEEPVEEEASTSENEAKPPKPKSAPKTKSKSQTRDASSSAAAAKGDGDGQSSERNYWLLKAEPETRLENGTDVRFSIDDLAAKTEPEPWDGIRAYPARNNLRAMNKGDLAFFYHSNCKEPGIVGTMEIVEEHSPDLSAHDPKAPYYDPSSKPSDPKWSVVHVKFRSKFPVQIGLKELRAMGTPGNPLENMQMLKQSRLSVSKVSAVEWEYLMGVAKEKGKTANA